MLRILRYILCVNLLVLTIGAWAQLVRPDVRMVGLASGLPHDQVQAMTFDRLSQLWVGTQDGLCCWDGLRAKVMRTNGTGSSIPNDHINALAVDAKGLVYVGSNSPYLTIIDPLRDTLCNIRLSPEEPNDPTEERINALFVARGDSLWVMHGRRKLSYFDKRSSTFTTTVIQSEERHPQGRDMITGAVQDGSGILWLSSHFGLIRFDPRIANYTLFRDQKAEPTDIGRHHVTSVMDQGNSLLVGTWGSGLFQFDKAKHVFARQWTPDATDGGNSIIAAMCIKDSAQIWIADVVRGVMLFNTKDRSMLRFDRDLDRDHSLNAPRFLPGANGLLADGPGRMWVSTLGEGVALIAQQQNRFQLNALPSTDPAKGATDVVAVVVDTIHQNEFVVTRDHGVFRKHGNGPYELLATGNGDAVLSGMVHLPGEGTILFTRSGMARYHEADQVFRPCCQGLGGMAIDHWTTDGANGLWCVVDGKQIIHIDPLSCRITPLGERFPSAPDTMPEPISALLMDREGRLWVAFTIAPPMVFLPDGNLLRFGIGKQVDEIPSAFVTSIVQDAIGAIWLSFFQHGVARILPNNDGAFNVQRFTTVEGLPSNSVYQLACDVNNGIWGTSKSGLFWISPQPKPIVTFGREQGLPAMDLNKGISVTVDGRVHVHLRNGIASFFPRELKPTIEAPTVQVLAMKVFGKTIATHLGTEDLSPIRLAPDEHSVRFELRTTNLLDPLNDVYQYRLNDLDTTWIELAGGTTVAYDQLAPGDHLFEVRVRTRNGPYSAVQRVAFQIAPPYYAKWWFRLLVFCCLLAIAIIVFRSVLRSRLSKQREAMEKQHAILRERERIAGDMHDDLGSGLSLIKVRGELAMMRERDPENASVLKDIVASTSELIDSMRQIVWTLGSGQESMGDLVAYLRSWGGNYLQEHGVALVSKVASDFPERTLTAEQRRGILLIVKEALHNVVKHANARQVELFINWKDGLCISIKDDGVGMDAANLDHSTGHGHRSMEKRAALMGGTISFTDANGLLVQLYIPDTFGTDQAERPIATAIPPSEL